MEKLTIKSWAPDDQPREKLVAKGKASLSDAELIAIIIGSGIEKRVPLPCLKGFYNLSMETYTN